MGLEIRYINLDREQGRRESIERQLRELGLADQARRFPALTGDGREARISQSELGCFLSHRAVIAGAAGDSHLVVLEDDARLTPHFARIEALLARLPPDKAWDVIFLGFVPDFFNLRTMSVMWEMVKRAGEGEATRFGLLEAARFYRWGLFAYVVNRASLGKLDDLLDDREHGFGVQVDVLVQRLCVQRRIAAQCILPFIVGTDFTITTSMADRPKMASGQFFRDSTNLFVAGADVSVLRDRHEAMRDEGGIEDPGYAAMVAMLHNRMRLGPV